MKRQVWKRAEDGSVLTDYVEVVFPTTPQPPKVRPVVISQMNPADLMAWRVSALNADLARTEYERDMLARAERVARATARATESIWAYTDENEPVTV